MKKNLLLTAFLFSSLYSTQAFCIHNYYSESCRLDSIQGEVSLYKRNYWLGHHMVLISDAPGIDDYTEVYLPSDDDSDEADPITGLESMVFLKARDFNLIKTPYDDGCWQGFTAAFERSVQVDDLKPIVSEILGIKKGDVLHMSCTYDHLEITGPHCDDL